MLMLLLFDIFNAIVVFYSRSSNGNHCIGVTMHYLNRYGMGPVDNKHGSQENHTLGNALRHVLLMNPRVMFAGYSMPHPFEDQMHLRIQTAEDYPAQEALKQALQDLKSLAAISKQKFLDAVSEYKQDHPDCMKTES